MTGADVVPALRTVECADASDDDRAAGDIPWSYVDMLELAEDAFAQHRSKDSNASPDALVRSWVTPDARTFATT